MYYGTTGRDPVVEDEDVVAVDAAHDLLDSLRPCEMRRVSIPRTDCPPLRHLCRRLA